MFENTKNKDRVKHHIRLAFKPQPRDEWSCQGLMTNSLYIFKQSPEQRRRVGARGGKAQARYRARQQTAAQVPPQTRTVIHPLAETAAQASRVWMLSFHGSAEPRSPPENQTEAAFEVERSHDV